MPLEVPPIERIPMNPWINLVAFSTLFCLAFLNSLAAQVDFECATPDGTYPIMMGGGGGCTDESSYTPDATNGWQNTPKLVFKLNYHFIRPTDGSGPYTGDMSSIVSAEVGGLNWFYYDIQPPTIGVPGTAYISDARVRFELAGIYYHDDDARYNHYLTDLVHPYCGPALRDEFGVDHDRVINIFYYQATNAGNYGCGPQSFVNMTNCTPDGAHALLAHELGHVLGLPHTFNCSGSTCGSDDVFTDTFYPDCNTGWQICGLTAPWLPATCSAVGTGVTNNIMGYNACRKYLSPMQMAHIQELNITQDHKRMYVVCSPHPENPTIIVSQSAVWESSKIINANIEIEPGVVLDVRCTLYMSPHAKIIVKQGGKMIVDGGKLTAHSGGCHNFWPGIEVWGDNENNQFPSNHPTYQGIVILKNGATIEHAREAFILQQNGVWNTFGGVIQATDANFVNCRRSTAFASYQNTTPGGSPIGNRSRFTRCQFIVDDDYRGGTDFYAHVSLWDVSGIVFTACRFINAQTAQSTVFNSDELGYGIISLDANFTVTGSCDVLYPCESGDLIPPCPPASLDPSEFIGLDHGIHATGSAGSTRTFTVTRSRFENNICGVFTSEVNNFSILRNEFVMGDRDVELTQDAGEDHWMEHHRAIYNYKGIGFRIEENHFSRVPGPDPDLEAEGPVMGYTGAVNCQVYKNTSDGINLGFVAEGNCMDISDPMQTGLGFYCNTNSDNLGRDFVVRKPQNDAITLGQSIKGFQGSPSLSAGNTFTPTQNDPAYEFYNYDNVAEYQAITYFWHDPPGQLNPGSYNTPWVQPYSTISPEHGCPTLIICGGGPAVKSLLSPEIEAAKTAWLSLRYVYKSLLDGGDFEDLRETIMASWPSDAWELRNDLMAHSPFLSVEILFEAAERNILPDAMMLEICLANPEATRQQDFIHWIEFEAPNPLPHYMIEQIMASWDEGTWRTSLEAAIGEQKGAMDRMNDQVIIALLNDSVPEPPDSVLIRWQENNSLGARFGEAITLIEMGEYTEATALMEGLEDDYRMDERAEEERDDMLGLIGVYAAADLEQQDLMHLDNAKLDALQIIAEGSPTHAGVGAQNLLCFGYEICYPTITGSSHALRSLLSTDGGTGNGSPAPLNVLPNPASTWVAFEHRCDVASDPAELIVRDIAGREVQRLKVPTSPGQVVWDTRRQSPGTYAVELHQHGRILSTQRFVLRP